MAATALDAHPETSSPSANFESTSVSPSSRTRALARIENIDSLVIRASGARLVALTPTIVCIFTAFSISA